MYVLHGTIINVTLSDYYETFTQYFSGFLHACKMVELYTIVTLFENMTLTLDFTVWRITYRNNSINKSIR